MGEHLASAPLVEALLEVRWKLREEANSPPLDPAYPLIVGLLYEQIKGEYGYVEVLPQSRLLPPQIAPYLVTHRFRVGQNRWPLVQIGPGLATLNFTTSYTWGDFSRAAQEFMTRTADAYRAAASESLILSQVALRYINAVHFDFQTQNVFDFLRDKLHIKCELPPGLTLSADGGLPSTFRFQVAYPLHHPAGSGLLVISQGQKDGQPALVWDLLVASAGADTPGLGEFADWLSQAHEVIENSFFALIEGDLHRRFQGGA